MNIVSFKENGHIGIIGAGGQMGRWALQLFNKYGYKNLHGYDIRQTEMVKVAQSLKVHTHIDLEETVVSSDLVIVSAPPSASVDVIHQVGPFMTDEKIFSDFTSLKEESCNAMALYKGDVIGIHPMFGGNTVNIQGQNIVLTPVEGRSKRGLPLLKEIFGETNAYIRVVSPQKHDQISALNLAAVHYTFLLLGSVLREECTTLRIEPEDIFKLNTLNSKTLWILLGRYFCREELETNWGIQNQTPYAIEIKEAFWHAHEALQRVFQDKDFKTYKGIFQRIRSKIGSVNLQIAEADSEILFSTLQSLGGEHRLQIYHDDTWQYLQGKIFSLMTHTGCIMAFQKATADCQREAQEYKRAMERQEKNTLILPKSSLLVDREDSSSYLAQLGQLYTTMEFQFRQRDYEQSEQTAIEMKRFLHGRLLRDIHKMPSIKGMEGQFRDLESALSTYIGKAKHLVAYRQHVKTS